MDSHLAAFALILWVTVTNGEAKAAGNILTRTDARGISASFTYDALNRVSTIS